MWSHIFVAEYLEIIVMLLDTRAFDIVTHDLTLHIVDACLCYLGKVHQQLNGRFVFMGQIIFFLYIFF